MNIIAFMILLIFSSLSFGHGEDKPGPHGGHIQMPANFHTELIENRDGSFKVYLIDMQFKNAMVKNSNVQGLAQAQDKFSDLFCTPLKDHFRCTSKVKIKPNMIKLKVTRDGTQAQTEAVYDLPLTSFPKPAHTNKHSGHY